MNIYKRKVFLIAYIITSLLKNRGEKMLNSARFIWVFIPFLLTSSLSAQTVLAEEVYGGSYLDVGYEAVETPDGDYLIVGYHNYSSYNDIYLIKADSIGGELWSQYYGGSYWDNGFSIISTVDGNYMIGGRHFSSSSTSSGDAYLLKVEPDGTALWDEEYGSSDKDGCNSVIQSSDSGYVFTGQYDYNDLWLLKADSSGNLLWSETYGAGSGRDVVETSDQNYLVTGHVTGADDDLFLGKVDSSSGDTLWTATVGGSGFTDRGYGICDSHDTGIIVAGYTDSYGAGGVDFYLVEFTPDGYFIRSETYGSSEDEHAFSIAQVTDGYILAGRSNSYGSGDYDAYLVKLDTALDTVWTETYGGSGDDHFQRVFCNSEGNYVCIGSTESFGNDSQIYFVLVKDDYVNVEDNPEHSEMPNNPVIRNHPNPFDSSTEITYSLWQAQQVTLAVYDICGRRIAVLDEGYRNPGDYSITFDASDISCGVYYAKLETPVSSTLRRMVLIDR